MKYEEAKKKVTAHKPQEGYMEIRLEPMSSSESLVLPYKAGIAFMEALASAELIKHNWGTDYRINSLEKDYFQVTMLSAAQYQRIRMAMLLGVSPADIQRAEESGNTDSLGS